MEEFNQILEHIYARMSEYPAIPLGMLVFLVIMGYRNWKEKQIKEAVEIEDTGFPAPQQYTAPQPVHRKTGLLDHVLFSWTPRDPFTVTDLLRSVSIFGAIGSGKTSGSGAFIGRALVRSPRISMLILASKPEDKEMWQKMYAKAGRSKDLLVFSPESGLRFNCLDFVQKMGGETRDITQALTMIGETLEHGEGSGGDDGRFWRKEQGRMIDNIVTIIRLATGRVHAPELQKFINGAAMKPDELRAEGWQSGFHSKCLEAAHRNARTSIERHNVQLAMEYWLKEFPSMADKMRSGILTGVLGTLHVFNQGVVRELMSTDSNITPQIFESGKSVLVDMAISSNGVAGAFVLGAWQYLTQWYILKRHAQENSPVICIWSDEHQKVMNSFCPTFLAECRSHRGCMVTLTQSIHSYYTRLKEGGEHEADSYLTNFYTKIAHALGDSKTAEYFGGLIGRKLTMHMGGSMKPAESPYDALFGQQGFSGSFSQQVENIVENTEFMQNMRTGGRQNGYVVDGIVVRSAAPFSTGNAYLKVAFSQRG